MNECKLYVNSQHIGSNPVDGFENVSMKRGLENFPTVDISSIARTTATKHIIILYKIFMKMNDEQSIRRAVGT